MISFLLRYFYKKSEMNLNKYFYRFNFGRKWPVVIVIFFGISLIISSFHSILSFGYGLDDFYLVSRSFQDALYKNIDNGSIHFRPIWYLSYPFVNIISDSSGFHHFVNLLIHFANCILVYFLIRKYLGNIIPILLIVTWSILPWCVIPYIWLAQRADLLMAFFLLLAVILSNNENNKYSYISTIAAYLSKSTCLFFPLAYSSRAILKRNKTDYIFGIFSFAIFLGIALLMYKNGLSNIDGNFRTENHSFPIFLKLANFVKNFVLNWFLLFLPIPFFTSFSHGIIWFFVSISLIFFLIKYGKFSSESRFFLLLALLVSFTSAITPELRITYIQTLFIIIFYFISIKDLFLIEKVDKYKSIFLSININFKSSCILILISLLFIISSYSNQVTAKNFKTEIYSLQKSKDKEHCLYVNNFYTWSREFQKKVLQKDISNLNKLYLCNNKNF